MKSIIIWLVLAFEILFAFAIWTRTEIADYDIKVAHIQMHTNYCPYCGENLKAVSK